MAAGVLGTATSTSGRGGSRVPTARASAPPSGPVRPRHPFSLCASSRRLTTASYTAAAASGGRPAGQGSGRTRPSGASASTAAHELQNGAPRRGAPRAAARQDEVEQVWDDKHVGQPCARSAPAGGSGRACGPAGAVWTATCSSATRVLGGAPATLAAGRPQAVPCGRLDGHGGQRGQGRDPPRSGRRGRAQPDRRRAARRARAARVGIRPVPDAAAGRNPTVGAQLAAASGAGAAAGSALGRTARRQASGRGQRSRSTTDCGSGLSPGRRARSRWPAG